MECCLSFLSSANRAELIYKNILELQSKGVHKNEYKDLVDELRTIIRTLRGYKISPDVEKIISEDDLCLDLIELRINS